MARLIDLDPRWVGFDFGHEWVRFGISFECPNYEHQRIVVYFKPYIDPYNFKEFCSWCLPEAPNPNTGFITKTCFWNRTGETFEDLTLTPSIDFKFYDEATDKMTGWHGFITNGEIITC